MKFSNDKLKYKIRYILLYFIGDDFSIREFKIQLHYKYILYLLLSQVKFMFQA